MGLTIRAGDLDVPAYREPRPIETRTVVTGRGIYRQIQADPEDQNYVPAHITKARAVIAYTWSHNSVARRSRRRLMSVIPSSNSGSRVAAVRS